MSIARVACACLDWRNHQLKGHRQGENGDLRIAPFPRKRDRECGSLSGSRTMLLRSRFPLGGDVKLSVAVFGWSR